MSVTNSNGNSGLDEHPSVEGWIFSRSIEGIMVWPIIFTPCTVPPLR